MHVQLLQKWPKPQLVPKAKKSAYRNITEPRENACFQQLGETQAQKKQCEQDRARIPAKQPQSNPTPSAVAIKQARKGQHVTQYHARSSPPWVMEEAEHKAGKRANPPHERSNIKAECKYSVFMDRDTVAQKTVPMFGHFVMFRL